MRVVFIGSTRSDEIAAGILRTQFVSGSLHRQRPTHSASIGPARPHDETETAMNAIILNAVRLTATLSLVISICAPSTSAQAAETRLEPIKVRDALNYDCAAPRQFRQYDVSRVFDVANLSQTWELRERLHLVARRACLAGADRVVLIRDDSQTHEHAWDAVAIRE
jgi:hypothetical protein